MVPISPGNRSLCVRQWFSAAARHVAGLAVTSRGTAAGGDPGRGGPELHGVDDDPANDTAPVTVS